MECAAAAPLLEVEQNIWFRVNLPLIFWSYSPKYIYALYLTFICSFGQWWRQISTAIVANGKQGTARRPDSRDSKGCDQAGFRS